jgi:hypothetical protein
MRRSSRTGWEKAMAMVGWKREEQIQVFTLQVAEVLTEAMDAAKDVDWRWRSLMKVTRIWWIS